MLATHQQTNRVAHKHWPRVMVFAAAALLGFSIFARLGTPLMWNDEGETAMYAQRILEVGYPKVHHGKNVLYTFDAPNELRAYNSRLDAYTNSGWLQFYAAVPGVLLAEHVHDPYMQTLILRLPFALAGFLALFLFAAAAASLLPKQHREILISAFLCLCALTTPLVLHVREVRYYSLALLCAAAAMWLVIRFHVLQRISYRKYVFGIALVLFVSFHTFYPLFLVLVATFGLLALRHLRSAWRATIRELIPIAIAGIAAAPFIWILKILTAGLALNQRYGFSVLEFLRNMGTVCIDLSTYGLLPAALTTAILCALLWRSATDAQRAEHMPPIRAAIYCGVFVGATVLVTSTSYVLQQRYYLAAMPVLLIIVLLCGWVCIALLREYPRRAARLVVSFLIFVLMVNLASGLPAVIGHIQEIRTPYQGPVDFIVQYIRSHVANPARAIIATNYEEQPFMYYLQSHVTIGQASNNLAADMATQPDIIIPRRERALDMLSYLNTLLARAKYTEVVLPVRDYYINNIPELRHPYFRHLFVTPIPSDGNALRIYIRQ
jgi:hypothetical protein